MSYSQLYAYTQSCTTHIKRSHLIAKAAEVTGGPAVKLFESGMDVTIIRGMFLRADGDNKFARMAAGRPVIVIARDQPSEWKRFVTIKELMHVFDRPLEYVGTATDFVTLVEELTGPAADGKYSPGLISEGMAFYKALGVLCPELRRQEYARRLREGDVTPVHIANELKIPESYVHLLLGPHFKGMVAAALEDE